MLHLFFLSSILPRESEALMLLGSCRFFVLSCLIFILIPCTIHSDEESSGVKIKPGDRIITGVPFIKQTDNKYCGPAALATVMEYYGDNIDQQVIAKSVYTPELNGSLISDMRSYASERGYVSKTRSSNTGELQKVINDNNPAIILIDRGKWKVSIPHYYVVYGYNKNEKVFIINDGNDKARRISYEKLKSEWQKMNNMMLLISK